MSISPRIAKRDPRNKPSNPTKERVCYLVQQQVNESGKIARQLCQQSGSRDVLMKSAKKMASQEAAMENTLSNLRHIEHLLDKALEQANGIGRSMEQTTVVQEHIKQLTGEVYTDSQLPQPPSSNHHNEMKSKCIIIGLGGGGDK